MTFTIGLDHEITSLYDWPKAKSDEASGGVVRRWYPCPSCDQYQWTEDGELTQFAPIHGHGFETSTLSTFHDMVPTSILGSYVIQPAIPDLQSQYACSALARKMRWVPPVLRAR